jgi:DNA polymerase-3 subunit delta
LKSRGLSIDEGALNFAVSRLGSDRGITRSELEKLSLYAMGEKTVTEEHVSAVMGDESELRMDEALDAAGEGDFSRLDKRLAQLWAAGTNPVAVLRAGDGPFPAPPAGARRDGRGREPDRGDQEDAPARAFSRARTR